MSEYHFVTLTREGPAARIDLARPDQLNALDPALIADLRAALDAVAASDARVLVLGAQGRAFCAGVDLKFVSSPAYTPEASAKFIDDARAIVTLLETMPQATIARVQGYCFTGGLELALGCDLIVAASDASFSDTHAKLGLISRWGMSQRLPRRIGSQRAREMSFTSRRVPADEAAAIGLILKAVPVEALDSEVDALVAQIAANSAESIAAYKQLFRTAENAGLDAGIAEEAAIRLARTDRAERIAGFTAR